MRASTAKKASKEIVNALKCVLEAQLGQRGRTECVPILKEPIHRFCDIARKTEKRFKKKYPDYDISRFLGAGPRPRRKMGVVCSSKTIFPDCDDAIKAHDRATEAYKTDDYGEYHKKLDVAYAKNYECQKEVVNSIRERPIERSEDYGKLLRSYETMRDWMHMSGYATPDYVWVVPNRLKGKVKNMFERLSSEEIRSPEDLERISEEIDRW